MERNLAKGISLLFHPLLITSVSMLIIFNSGTSLSVLQPEVKKISLIIIALFTFAFPALLIIFLNLTNILQDIELKERKERTLPVSIIIILYMFTFFIMRGIPQLTRAHVVFMFCPAAALFIALLLNYLMKPSLHMLAMGVLSGIILSIIIFFGAEFQILFIVGVLISGLMGTSRLILKMNNLTEVVAGFFTGFLVTAISVVIFIA